MGSLDGDTPVAVEHARPIPKPPVIYRAFLNKRSGKLYEVETPTKIFSPPDYIELTQESTKALKILWNNLPGRLRSLKNKHSGCTAHVLGNGPSLNSTVGKISNGHIVIGVNGAFIARPLDYWICLDDMDNFNKPIMTECKGYFIKDSTSIKLLSKTWTSYDIKKPDYILENGGFNIQQDALSWNGSSVHAALNLAIYMGCVKIVLHGVDYNNRSHFYKPELECPTAPKDWGDMHRHIVGFEKLGTFAASKGIIITNANPKSMLITFLTEDGMVSMTQEQAIKNSPPAPPQQFAPIRVPFTIDPEPMVGHLHPPEPMGYQAIYHLDTNMLEIRKNGKVFAAPFCELKSSEYKQVLAPLKALGRLAESTVGADVPSLGELLNTEKSKV